MTYVIAKIARKCKVLHIALDPGSRYVLLKTEMLLFLYLEQFNKWLLFVLIFAQHDTNTNTPEEYVSSLRHYYINL